MKQLFISSVFCLCSTFALAAPQTNQVSPDNQNDNSINIIVRPQIAGLWGMKIPNNNKCVEYYNFKSSNQVIIKSASEWSTGIYEYQPSPENSKIGALALQVKYDNNQKDCSGHQQDQAGEVSQYFVQWRDANTIQFCASEKQDKCMVTLHRVLP